MRPIPTKVTGDQAFADEYTSMSQEEINFVLLSSQSLNALDDNQLSKAACNYTSQADYYTTTGSSPNTYLATPPSPILGVSTSTYLDGQRFRINITATNTGPSTLSIQSVGNPLGQVTIRKGLNFNELEGGELVSGFTCEVIYVQAQSAFLLVNNGFSNIAYNGSNITLSAELGTPQLINAVSTFETIIFDSQVFDPSSSYNAGTGEFTVPVTGLYTLNSQSVLSRLNNSGAPNNADMNYSYKQSFFVNGVGVSQATSQSARFVSNSFANGEELLCDSLSDTIFRVLNKNDVITVRALVDSATFLAQFPNNIQSDDYTRLSIDLILPF